MHNLTYWEDLDSYPKVSRFTDKNKKQIIIIQEEESDEIKILEFNDMLKINEFKNESITLDELISTANSIKVGEINESMEICNVVELC